MFISYGLRTTDSNSAYQSSNSCVPATFKRMEREYMWKFILGLLIGTLLSGLYVVFMYGAHH